MMNVMIKKRNGTPQLPTQVFSLEIDGQKMRYRISMVVVVSLTPFLR